MRALRTARELLPGDENFGDQLSTGEDRPSAVIARFLIERQATRGEDGARGAGSAASEAGLAAESGVRGALSIRDGLTDVEVAGHRPRLRAGLHCGQPRKLGGDYLGTDVNIAARVGEAAGADEVLIDLTVPAPILTNRWSTEQTLMVLSNGPGSLHARAPWFPGQPGQTLGVGQCRAVSEASWRSRPRRSPVSRARGARTPGPKTHARSVLRRSCATPPSD